MERWQTHSPFSLTLRSLALAKWLLCMRNWKGLKWLHLCVVGKGLSSERVSCQTWGLSYSFASFTESVLIECLLCTKCSLFNFIPRSQSTFLFPHGLANLLVFWNVSTSVLPSNELKWNLIIPAKFSRDSVIWIKSMDSRLDCKHQIHFTAKVKLLSWHSVLLEG